MTSNYPLINKRQRSEAPPPPNKRQCVAPYIFRLHKDEIGCILGFLIDSSSPIHTIAELRARFQDINAFAMTSKCYSWSRELQSLVQLFTPSSMPLALQRAQANPSSSTLNVLSDQLRTWSSLYPDSQVDWKVAMRSFKLTREMKESLPCALHPQASRAEVSWLALCWHGPKGAPWIDEADIQAHQALLPVTEREKREKTAADRKFKIILHARIRQAGFTIAAAQKTGTYEAAMHRQDPEKLDAYLSRIGMAIIEPLISKYHALTKEPRVQWSSMRFEHTTTDLNQYHWTSRPPVDAGAYQFRF